MRRLPGQVTLLLAAGLLLTGCLGSDNEGPSVLEESSTAPQPFPQNYRAEALAFMRSYLNDPVGVRDAAMAEPVQRPVSGRLRYVGCVRFTPRESDGSYGAMRERAIVYVNGRLDRVVEKAGELCAGVYASFPELEKLSR